MNNCLTIDVGTTNTKLTLWSENTKELKKFTTPKIVHKDQVDFDLPKLWQDLLTNLISFDATKLSNVKNISIASVGESGVLLDKKTKQEVGHCIAWFDERSQVILDKLTVAEKSRIYEISGLPVNAHYSASKISWLLKYDKSISASDGQFVWLCIPDYLVFQFTGNLATESTIASRTLCLNVQTGTWSDEIKRIFGISNVSFPPIFRAGEELGTVTGNVAALFNDECAVTIAGHDHMCGASGIRLKDNELLDSTGTTEAIMALTLSPDTTAEAQKLGITNGIYTDGKHNTRFSVIPSAGSTIAWFMKTFKIDENGLRLLMEKAEDAYDHHEIFESQVVVVPHFKGSGSPNKLPLSKGLIYGLTTETTLKELTFGLFLGLTCEYYVTYSAIFAKGKYHRIKVIGPAVQDDLWLQLKADLFGIEVDGIAVSQAVSQGAYSLATNDYLQNDMVRYMPTSDTAKRRYLLQVMLEKYQKIYHDKISNGF